MAAINQVKFWRELQRDTLVSMIINVIMEVGVCVLAFRHHATIPLGGSGGFAVDLLPATALPALFMGLLLGMAVRKKVRSGAYGTLPRAQLWAPLQGLASLPFLARAVTVALLAVVCFPPIPLLLALLFRIHRVSFAALIAFKVIHGIFLAIGITPLVVLTGVADSSALMELT